MLRLFRKRLVPKVLNVTQLAMQAEAEGLQLPHPAKDGRYNTLNERGAMSSKISQSDELFIKIASQPGAKVLDIGPAYGQVCLEALKKGASDYVAVDIEIKHLQILAQRVMECVPETDVKALTLICGAFPRENVLEQLERNSFDAILANFVLHFFTEKQVKESFRQFSYLLKPGGKLIATMGAPYIVFLKQEVRDRLQTEVANFLKAPDDRKEEVILPGFIESTREAFDLTEEGLDNIGMTKGHIFLFDQVIAEYLLRKERFNIEQCQYYNLNEMWKLDDKNKDHLRLVAHKPLLNSLNI